MTLADFETARAARGLRIVWPEKIPSPWSQAALGLFDMKGFDYLRVPFRPFAQAVREHTGAVNAPVVLFDDEPPRTGWAEILALAERLGGRVSLVPDDDDRAVRMYGLSHALMAEGGLGWSVRLLLTHASVTTNGREGWPAPVAAYLAPKYGYAADRVPAARARAIRVLNLLARTLADSEAAGYAYLLGPAPTALDVYAATSLGVIQPLPPEMCPMADVLRHAVATLDADVRAAVPASLLRHRDLMYARHLRVPVRL
ncbi:MAG TPA: hypothetical protein VHO67_06415 [Polyangia bacterium]|nr:hypothetical protein [Polyangia bacterium]